MSAPRAVLITGSAGDDNPYEAVLRALGYHPIFDPMLRIERSGMPLPDLTGYGSLIFTSRHALAALAAQTPDRDFQIYTVGDTTAAAACEAGFTRVMSAGGTVDDLMVLLARDTPARPLYVRGEDVAHPLPGIEGYIIYRAIVATDLSDATRQALTDGQLAAAVFLSARGGQAFTRIIGEKGLKGALSGIKALCLSNAVLESLSVLPWQTRHVATTPDRAGMVALLEALLER